MLSVLLTILKIIGLVLMVLLGIVLLLLFLILFMPIRYKANGSYEPLKDGSENSVFLAKFSVRWFLPFSYLTGEYNNGLFYHAKIFGHILFTTYADELKRKEKKEAKKAAKKNAKQEKKAFKEQTIIRKQQEKDAKKQSKAVKQQEKDSMVFESMDASKETELYSKADSNSYDFVDSVEYQNEPLSSKEHIQDGFFQKIHLFKKGKEIFHRLKCTFLSICDKIKEIFGSIEYYLDLWNKKSTQKEVQICKDRIIKLLKHIMPRKWRFYLHAGFEDPATTGKLMGFFGMLIAVFGKHICVVPDFENPVLESDFNIKGRIRLLTVIMIVLQFYFDKNLKRILEYAKKGGR